MPCQPVYPSGRCSTSRVDRVGPSTAFHALLLGASFEVTAHCCTLVLDQTSIVGEVQDGTTVAAQFPVLGRRATRLAEPITLAVPSGLRHDSHFP